MTGASWAAAALLCWHLSTSGGLPPEVRPDSVRPYARGERPVRVLVFGGASSVSLRAESGAAIEEADTGRELAVLSPGASATLQPAGQQVRLEAGRARAAAARVRIIPRGAGALVVSTRGGWGRRGRYRGALEVSPAAGALRVVEHAALEDYVAGVIAAEMPGWFHLEAVKAQAIAARTYSLSHLGDHEADGADLCARVHCQAYLGAVDPGSAAARAAAATAGQVLAWNGVLVDALYHSACGGATARAWETRQGKLLPYLVGGPDISPLTGEPYCARDRDVSWRRRFTLEEASRLVRANLGAVRGDPRLAPAPLRSLETTMSRHSNRVQWLEVRTRDDLHLVRGDAIRWLFGTGFAGPEGLRSTAFTLTTEPGAFVFEGVGHGHGLGLCQWGARGRAEEGQSAAEILAAYYPGASILRLADPPGG